MLVQWMEIEGPLNKVSSVIYSLIKNDEIRSVIHTGFKQLELIVNFCDIIGITVSFSIHVPKYTHMHTHTLTLTLTHTYLFIYVSLKNRFVYILLYSYLENTCSKNSYTVDSALSRVSEMDG